MGKFKRYDGYVMHIPQEFIDSKLPVCPFCKSDNPHWLLDSRMEMSLAGSRTYYQCERCQAIISSTAADASAEKGKGFGINPAMAALNAAQKGTKHQEVGVAYMRVDDLGTVCTDTSLRGQEFPITHFQAMIAPTYKYCSNCGKQIDSDSTFCSGCGAKQNAAAPAPAPEPAPAPAPVQPEVVPIPVAPVPTPVAVQTPVADELRPYKFPIAALILVGLALLGALLTLTRYNIVNSLFTIIPLVLMTMGLIMCKKPRNVLFGIGFLTWGVLLFVNFVRMSPIYSSYYYYSIQYQYIIWDLLLVLPMTMIGITNLVGRPGIRALKLVFAILALFLVVLELLLARRIYFTFYTLINLLSTILPLVAVFLYTPFKKHS